MTGAVVAALFLCSLTAGFLFAFAVVVMPGIRTLDDAAYLRAFQTMDGIIQDNNPLFILMWAGSALAMLAVLVLALGSPTSPGRLLLLGAAGLYLVGVQLPTLVVNIPLNNRLQALEIGEVDGSAVSAAREAFDARWNRWNVVRTVVAVVSVLMLLAALVPTVASAQSITPPSSVDIRVGSGAFDFAPGPEGRDAPIEVHYHRPETFSSHSPILLVVPGAGRNADDYRDAWIGASERYGVLVVAPSYPASRYDFGAYHMGGLMSGMNLEEAVRREPGTNRAHLDEEVFEFDVNTDRDAWIFADFDRLFEVVARSVESDRRTYDAFGHSAGGQILHRMALFRPDSRASRLVAANSGFFTLPDLGTSLPFGLRDTGLGEADLEAALKVPLILFQGEFDDGREHGGTMLRSPTADRQGTHRIGRARWALEFAEDAAVQRGVHLAWSIEVVRGVGHDHARMSRAAARYLYGPADPP